MIDALESRTRAADELPAACTLSLVPSVVAPVDAPWSVVRDVVASHFRPAPVGVAAMLALFSADPAWLCLENFPEEEGVERVRASLYELGGMSVIA